MTLSSNLVPFPVPLGLALGVSLNDRCQTMMLKMGFKLSGLGELGVWCLCSCCVIRWHLHGGMVMVSSSGEASHPPLAFTPSLVRLKEAPVKGTAPTW
ncbi:hypothetical protein B0T18DRAFT_2582 [Schizothecium vesticola]|uniref:Uncharacterized protein n=1 Tax=Schizothecium vesticola TaxID=314040 RepID=A0AA40F7U3_9PEZI|nr:hypothetical protein B0T18DRAFT_2582 [Schizothecium vesticola]